MWGKIEEIKACKDSKFGAQKYQIKLVGVEELLWVFGKDLSVGVVEKYKLGTRLPKNARAHVNRGYVERQIKFRAQVIIVNIFDVCCYIIAIPCLLI